MLFNGADVTAGTLSPIGGAGDKAHFPRAYLNIGISKSLMVNVSKKVNCKFAPGCPLENWGPGPICY